MVVIKNIHKDKTTISCDYYPEDSEYKGHILVNIASREIIEHEASGFPGRLVFTDRSYAGMARERLVQLYPSEKMPERDVVMWY